MAQNDYTQRETELFIKEELERHAAWLAARFREALEQNRNVRSGALRASIAEGRASTTGSGAASVDIDLLAYGRLMEIAGRRRLAERRNARVWARRNTAGDSRTRKKTAWYNRNKYAGFGRLISRLSAGMSERELERVRDIIKTSSEEWNA